LNSQKGELKKFFEKQIVLENKIVDLANAEAGETDNVFIADLLRGIALDSIKHTSMLSAVISLISGPTPLIEEKHMEALGEHVKEHIELEKEAVETYKKQLELVEDERVKLVLRYLVQDEQKHHQLLKRIEKLIIQPQTLTEDDLWDMFWNPTSISSLLNP
jgi:Mn-containing catalase